MSSNLFNSGRIGLDSTVQSQRDVLNNKHQDYYTANFFTDPAAGRHIDFATSFPTMTTAGSHLGDYDILDRRIRGSQTWSLMPYAVSAVVSTAVATEGVAPFQIFPSWLGKQSKRLKHRRWLRDMRSRGVLGSSGEGMLDTLDCLRSMLFVKGKTAGEIVERLVDIGATRDDMLETITDMTYKEDAERVALDTKTKGGITREWKKIEAKMTVVRGSAPDTVEDVDDVDDIDSDAEMDML